MNHDEKISITKYDLLYEQRMTHVETMMETMASDMKDIKRDIKADFRWLLGMMIAIFGLMAHGFHWF